MASLGKLVVSLGLDAAEFTKGLTKAEAEAQRRTKAIQQSVEAGVQGVAVALGALTAQAFAAYAAFDQLAKSAGDFKDLEEKTGATAESIASLSVAAEVSGLSLESLGGLMNKLTKNLSAVDDESKDAGAALQALGLNITDFKNLSPDRQVEAVAQALSNFKDGAQKSAVAMALFGKAGAEALPFLNELASSGRTQIKLTQEQIELADSYGDAQSKLRAEIKLYATSLAIDALPALIDFQTAVKETALSILGVDSSTKNLSANTAVKDFADGAVKSLAFVVDALDLISRLFEIAGKSIAGYAAVTGQLVSGNLDGAKAAGRAAEEAIQSAIDRETLGARLDKVIATRRKAEAAALANPASYSNEGRTSGRPVLNYTPPSRDKNGAKDKQTEAEKYLDALEKQTQQARDLSAVEKVLDDIENKRFEGATEGQRRLAFEYALEIDQRKQLGEQLKAEAEQYKQFEQAQKAQKEEGKRVFDSTRTSGEVFVAELERLNKLQEEGAISWETYNRAVDKAGKTFDDATAKTDRYAVTAQNAADAITQTLGDQVYQALKGNFDGIATAFSDTILRMVAQAQSAKLAKYLFGDLVGGEGSGSFGGILSSIFAGGAATSAPAGTGSAYGASNFTALATGTDYVPYDGFKAILHEGEKVIPKAFNRAAAAGGNVTIENHGAQVTTEKDSNGDTRILINKVKQEIAKDLRGGGVVSSAMQGTYGLNRQLPRRGAG